MGSEKDIRKSCGSPPKIQVICVVIVGASVNLPGFVFRFFGGALQEEQGIINRNVPSLRDSSSPTPLEPLADTLPAAQ